MKTHHDHFWKGQLLELQIDNGELYQTQIIKFNEDKLYLHMPSDRRQEVMPIQHRLPVTIYFQNHDHELNMFEALLLFHNNRLSVQIPTHNQIQKVQRRHYFRVPATLDLTISLDLTAQPKANSTKIHPFITKDISGGGLSFLAPFQIQIDHIIIGEIHIHPQDDEQTIPFEGRIINSFRTNNQFQISCEFINMKESVRIKIIRFCLNRQIKLGRNRIIDDHL